MKKLNVIFYLVAFGIGVSIVFCALIYKIILLAFVLMIRFILVKENNVKNQITGFLAAGIIIGYLFKLFAA